MVAPLPPFALMTEKTLPRMPSCFPRRCARGEAHEGLEQIGGRGGTFNEFAGSRPHGVDNDLRLVQIADGKDRGVGHLLMKKFNGPQSQSGIVGGNVDQGNVGIGSAYAPGHRIGGRHRKTCTGVNRARHIGAVDEYLQHRALLVVRGHDDDCEFWHNNLRFPNSL